MDKQEFAQRIFIELVSRTEMGTTSPSDLAIRAIHFAEDFEAEWQTHGANAAAEPGARDRRA
jgi:hypothetical protein